MSEKRFKYVMVFLGGIVLGMLIVLKVLEWNGTILRAEDRHCYPGMAQERIDDRRVVCVGGHGETWVVEK